ncbi:MAG: peptidylprolyl isomerase [Deltaproteobacteria bacterium]|nr:peptidylprolyl isomerase [Deltaproteobacteria bacterium]
MRTKKLHAKRRPILEKIVVPFTLVAIIVFSVLSGGEADVQLIDKIVAVVNDDIITLSELREITVPYLKKMKARYSVNYDEAQIKETESRILDQLIDEKLVKQEVVRLKIVVSEKEVAMGVEDMMKNTNLSEDQFKKALAEQDITMEEYREQMKNEMERLRLLDAEVKSKVQVKEKEIESYYKEHMDNFNTPPEVRLQQILLMIPPGASEQEISQIRGRAEEIVQKIKKGEDFTSLVRLYSQDSSAATGGDIGFFKQGELMPAINEVAFSLYIGEASSVIQTSAGFHIIKVLEKRERQKMTEEERNKEIWDILYTQNLDDMFKQWLKELRKKSFIESNL